MSKTLLLDGDMIAYQAAAVAEDRSIRVTHKPTGIQKSFQNHTKFKESMKLRGKEVTDEYLIEDMQEAQSPALMMKVIKARLKKYKTEVGADNLEIYIGGKGNFRETLPLPTRYKGNREGLTRPLLLQDAKQYLERVHKAKVIHGHEADDELFIRSYEIMRQGGEAILWQSEKDTRQGVGLWLHEFTDPPTPAFQVPELGYLTYETGKGVKGMGIKFLAFQWLAGDPADAYCAYDLTNVKFGPKTCYDLLKDLETPQQVLETVRDTFKRFYPEQFTYTDYTGKVHESVNYCDMMSLYFKCCWMKRTTDDPSDYRELFTKYGVKDD